jgi:hypothetical protein
MLLRSNFQQSCKTLDKLDDPSEPHSVEAAGIAKHMQSTQFILCLLVFEEILLMIHVVHKALPGSEMTLSGASTLVEQLTVNFSKRRNNETWIATYNKVQIFCAENNLSVHLPVESTPSNANETIPDSSGGRSQKVPRPWRTCEREPTWGVSGPLQKVVRPWPEWSIGLRRL